MTIASKAKFVSLPTITFTEGPKQVDVPNFLAELKKLGVDVSITEGEVQALQRASPQMLKWMALNRTNVEKFASNPKKELKKVLPDLLVPTMAKCKGFNAKYRLSSPEQDAAIQNLLHDVVEWAGSSSSNMLKLASSPDQAVEAVATDQPETVIKGAKAALRSLSAAKEQTSLRTTLLAYGSVQGVLQKKKEL